MSPTLIKLEITAIDFAIYYRYDVGFVSPSLQAAEARIPEIRASVSVSDLQFPNTTTQSSFLVP
jgi:hypothetical protein